MKICSKCVIPETAETLTFNKEDGSCTVCNNSKIKNEIDWDERNRTLDRLIKDYKNKFSYDCVVPFSGGKDSTFALWYLVKIKKLKPLVVRFDHNFYREKIEENTQRTIS